MKAIVGGKTVELTDADVLGVGGEACVYRHGALAVKIYHPPVDEKKLAKVQSFPSPVPDELVAPLELVTDAHGKSIGFTMPAIPAAEPVLRLTQRRWREGAVSNQQVAALFARLHDAVTRVHAAGIVCGDLNDANVLFRDDAVWLIDADSVQFGKHLCVVAHERYLDPRLYGRDLTRGPAFDASTDWYAFAVMLFTSLTYVHPYGGTHAQYPTLLRRAEARHSVMRPDVTYPKAAVPFGILPDDLLHWFAQAFDHGRREAMPAGLLAMRFTKCACGQEHARTRCPACSALGLAAQRDAVVVRGRCTARQVFRTRGRVLAAVVQGGLKYLYEEDGVVRREDRTRVMEEAAAPGMRFAIQGDSTWIGAGSQLVRVHAEALAERTATGTFENEPAFDAWSGGCYRLENEWLMDAATGTRAGKLIPGQSWFRVGERLGFGFWRAGRHVHHVLFRTDRPGLCDVNLPRLDGRLTDAVCYFDDDHVLFVRTVVDRGVLARAMDLVHRDGRVLASVTGGPDGARMLASAHGKALLGGRVLCATDQGLLALKAEAGTFVEGTLFADTEPFVQSGATLLPGPGGSVWVVTTKEITQLALA